MTTGQFPRSYGGTILQRGEDWRIEFEKDSVGVRDATAILGKGDRIRSAVNDDLKTWFLPETRRKLAATSPLFRLGMGAEEVVARVAVDAARDSVTSSGTRREFAFRYNVSTLISGELVSLTVRCEVSLDLIPTASAAPWRSEEIFTGFTSVDEAVAASERVVRGRVARAVIHVSRKLDGGPWVEQTITRSIERATPAAVTGGVFDVPPSYQHQDPVIGGFGAQLH
jgi:hypothetical protein